MWLGKSELQFTRATWGNCFFRKDGEFHPWSHQNPQAFLIILRIEAWTVLSNGGHFIVLSATFAMSVTSPCLAIVIFHLFSSLFLWGTIMVRDPAG